MPLILSGNVASATAGAYEVANSCRFDDGSSTEMNKTISSTSTTWTFSCWIKLNPTGTNQYLASWDMGSGESLGIGIEASTNQLFIYTTSTAAAPKLYDGKLRDPSAWMNIVIKNSSGTITSYINGTQAETSITGTALASGTLRIGCYTGSNYFYDGYMAEVVLIDGTAYSADSFGEFDEDSPTIWKPKDVSGLTFGSDGFYCDYEASDNLGNDANGGTDLTEANLAATDQSSDSPTNNFCTLNPLDAHTTSPTFAEGNLDFHAPSGTSWTPSKATIAVSKGKWYAEFKAISATATLGVCSTQSPCDLMQSSTEVRSNYRLNGGYWYGQNNGGFVDDQGDNSETFTDDDICMCALDMDNGYFYFGINGTWVNGQDGSTTGDPAGNNGGSGGAGNPSSQLLTNQHDGVYTFFAGDGSTAATGQIQANFGNPPYANSSDAADADGYGAFEYAPPSGYYALCTKNLAEYG